MNSGEIIKATDDMPYSWLAANGIFISIQEWISKKPVPAFITSPAWLTSSGKLSLLARLAISTTSPFT